MKTFRQFLEEEIANCTGGAISGTGSNDVSMPKAPLLFKKLMRRKTQTGS